jgi:quercetin dioxygenase-like cupin family protein
MRRHVAMTSIVFLVLGGMLAVGPAMTRADQTTPSADPFAGVTVEALSNGVPTDTGGNALLLLRVTMEPGAAIPAHRHPGPVALAVDTGTFRTRFVEGEGQLTRAAAEGTPAAAEQVTAGNEYTLNPGDSLFYEGAAHTMENGGDDTLVLLVSALFDPDEPGFLFLEGTPTP